MRSHPDTILSFGVAALIAVSLFGACSHEPPKPTPEEIAAQKATVDKAAADKAAAEKAAADKIAADKAAADAQALKDAQAKLDAAVAALPPAPALPTPPANLAEADSPKDNPLTPEKASLGRQLFFDKRLSKSGAMSCESCHHPAQAFTSGNATDAKDNGKPNTRNAPSMYNLGFHANGYYWDGRKPTLETVTQAAWAGQLAGDAAQTTAALNLDPVARALFQRAFGGEATAQNIPMALASFLRVLKSGDAPWDKFEAGDKKAASKDAQAGFKLFSAKGCTLCHLPPLYSDTLFHNAGIGWDAEKKAFADHGRMDASKDPADDGKFKTPSLRDAALTAPYFHDGSAKTLGDAIETMANGGVANPGLDAKLKPAKLNKKQREQIRAFIESLSGTSPLASAP